MRCLILLVSLFLFIGCESTPTVQEIDNPDGSKTINFKTPTSPFAEAMGVRPVGASLTIPPAPTIPPVDTDRPLEDYGWLALAAVIGNLFKTVPYKKMAQKAVGV